MPGASRILGTRTSDPDDLLRLDPLPFSPRRRQVTHKGPRPPRERSLPLAFQSIAGSKPAALEQPTRLAYSTPGEILYSVQPKLYSVDAALALAASRETTPIGFHLETRVASDLLVWRDGAPTRELYHWRLGSGQEVDFILAGNGQRLPVEAKAADTVPASEARHVIAFCERHAHTPRGVVLSNDPEIRVLRAGVIACPWCAVL